MQEFELKSQKQLSELDQTHQQQLQLLEQSISDESNNSKSRKKWSKDLIQYRRRQLLMADQQRYQEAQQTKLVSDALEEKELSAMNSTTDTSLMRRERTMKKQHQAEMDVLLKRIESKQREYVKRRNVDCDRLLQRNKNIQSSFDSKHVSMQFVCAFMLVSCE